MSRRPERATYTLGHQKLSGRRSGATTTATGMTKAAPTRSGSEPPCDEKWLAHTDDVDDEHQGVVPADPGLGHATRSVTLVRGNAHEHAGPDLLADEGGVPPRDDYTDPDRELDGGS